ncbi:hypothetical protein D3C80_1074580 [compost metagenome]
MLDIATIAGAAKKLEVNFIFKRLGPLADQVLYEVQVLLLSVAKRRAGQILQKHWRKLPCTGDFLHLESSGLDHLAFGWVNSDWLQFVTGRDREDRLACILGSINRPLDVRLRALHRFGASRKRAFQRKRRNTTASEEIRAVVIHGNRELDCLGCALYRAVVLDPVRVKHKRNVDHVLGRIIPAVKLIDRLKTSALDDRLRRIHRPKRIHALRRALDVGQTATTSENLLPEPLPESKRAHCLVWSPVDDDLKPASDALGAFLRVAIRVPRDSGKRPGHKGDGGKDGRNSERRIDRYARQAGLLHAEERHKVLGTHRYSRAFDT